MKIRRTFEVSIEHDEGTTNDGQVRELLTKAVRHTFGQKHVASVVRCGQPATANEVFLREVKEACGHRPGVLLELPTEDGFHYHAPQGSVTTVSRVGQMTVIETRPSVPTPFSVTASIGGHDWRNIFQPSDSRYNEQVCRKTGVFRFRLFPGNGGDEKWNEGLSPREHREWLLVAGGRPDIEEEVSIVTNAWRHRWKNSSVGPSEWVEGQAPR